MHAKQPNEHWVDGEGVMHIQLTQGKEALIDAADWPLVRDYRWHVGNVARKGNRPQWRVMYRNTLRSTLTYYLYHLILGKPPKGYVVDHINRNPLDNRRSNLRFATYSENARNSTRYLSNVREPALLRVS